MLFGLMCRLLMIDLFVAYGLLVRLVRLLLGRFCYCLCMLLCDVSATSEVPDKLGKFVSSEVFD